MQTPHLRAIVRAAVELTTRHDRDAVLDVTLAELERLVPFDAAAVLILEGEELRVLAARGLRRDLDPAQVRFRRGENPRLDRALAARGTVRFADPTEPDPFDGLVPGRLDHLHSCMAAPMRLEGHPLGLITLDAHRVGTFEAHHEELAELFAALAAAAIQSADLVSALERARAQLAGEVATLTREIRAATRGCELVGSSPVMRALRDEIALVGPTDTTVLVLGETGTGKELVARALHERSQRAAHPLLRFDCSAVAPSLIEAELYGHVRGAFTGAVAERAGRFEAADGRTLFLDEVGELPLEVQPRLLRALQEGEAERVGEQRVRRFDVRVIAATNRDLGAEVRSGRFRADLFHRLAVYPLLVPRLADRLEDVPELVRHFAAKLSGRLQLEAVEVEDGFLEVLMAYPWPGNVRELENTVERALVRARAGGGRAARLDAQAARDLGLREGHPATPATAASVTLEPALPPPQVSLREATESFQLAAIEAALNAAGGNMAEAARRLGEDRSNLHRRLRRLRRRR